MQRKLFFLAYFFICEHCFSQQYPFVYYTPKDGLVNSRVKTIRQDSKGRMYFITYGGLSIYDGTKFTNYNRDDGLANEVINDIAEWNSDTMLISCNAQKLNMLVNGHIEVYETTDHFYPTINRFLKSNDGKWYVTADEGLFLLSGKKFIKLPIIFNGRDFSRNLDRIVEFEHYFLIVPWASEWTIGIILYDREQQKVVDTFSSRKAVITDIDQKKRIWVNTPNSLKLLNHHSIRKGRLKLDSLPKPLSTILDKESTRLFFDASGNYWFYSKNRICKIAPGYKMERISSAEGFKGGINDLFQDQEGILWIALDGAGVIKLKSTNIQLLNSVLPSQQMSFSSIEQKNDTTWLFNRLDNKVYRITNNGTKKFSLTPSLTAYNMHVNGNKIFFSDTRNLFFINDKDNAGSYLHPQVIIRTEADILGNNIIDPYGSILQLWKKDDSTYFISAYRDTQKIFEHRINYLADQMTIDGQNRLWLATRNNHILVFTIDPQHQRHYLQLAHDFSKELPPEMNPRSIAVDKQHTIWVGTRFHGIYQFKHNGTSLQLMHRYTTHEGLTDNFVYTLCTDADDNIWIGTQTGLDKIVYRDGKYVIVNVGKNNNIFQTVYRIEVGKNKTTLALNSDGTLLRIKPETMSPVQKPVSFFLTSIKVNDGLVNTSLQNFSYRQNNFSFSVAAPSFFDEKSIRYSYLLEGSGNIH